MIYDVDPFTPGTDPTPTDPSSVTEIDLVRSRFNLVEEISSKSFTQRTQKDLRLLENKDFFAYYYVSEMSQDIAKFLVFTSLPWSRKQNRQELLSKLWSSHDCTLCPNVLYRHTMSTGNLDAKYVIIGDAPGQGDGKERYFDRVMVYGPTSHLLRRALLRSSIYFDSWIMNLMRCSFPSNRKGKRSEYDRCFQYVESEILLLENVTTVFLLGRHVKDYFEQRFGIRLSFYKDRDRVRQIQLGHRELRVAAVYHPSYFLRSGLGVDQCTESFERVLQLTKGSY